MSLHSWRLRSLLAVDAPYWALWWLCTASVVYLIFGFEYLPMVDLPQHAGQIAIWRDWNDPSLLYQSVYRQAPLPPAFVATALAFALTHFMSVELALKVVIASAVLGIPLVVRLLVREVGGNPWWVFLTFPIGFGFPFGFGFINYSLGVPVALLLVLLAVRYAERPSPVLAAGLFGTTLLLFAIHVIAFGFGMLVAGSIIMLRSSSLRQTLVRTGPLLLWLPFVLVWLVATRESEPSTHMPPEFHLGVHRLLLLPVYVIGGDVSAAMAVLGVMMFAVPFISGGQLAAERWRWVVLGVAAALFVIAPQLIFGTAFIYQRFAVFCIPGLLFALDWPSERRDTKSRAWLSGLAPLLALILLSGVGIRFWRFNVEVGGLDQILTQIPRGARLLYLPLERKSTTSVFPLYLHSGMWHQVRQGGVTDFSFARFHMNRFRYCDGAAPTLPLNFEWGPTVFDWERHWGDEFDYFLVRSFEDSRPAVFKEAVGRVSLVDRNGAWWLFRRLPGADESDVAAERRTMRRSCAD